MGELWGVFCGYLWENWPRYNGTTLYCTCTFTLIRSPVAPYYIKLGPCGVQFILKISSWMTITIVSGLKNLLFNGSCHTMMSECNALKLLQSGHMNVMNHQQLNCLFNSLSSLITREMPKLCIAGILWAESTGEQWISLTKGQQRGKCFHVMTSSCQISFAFIH